MKNWRPFRIRLILSPSDTRRLKVLQHINQSIAEPTEEIKSTALQDHFATENSDDMNTDAPIDSIEVERAATPTENFNASEHIGIPDIEKPLAFPRAPAVIQTLRFDSDPVPGDINHTSEAPELTCAQLLDESTFKIILGFWCSRVGSSRTGYTILTKVLRMRIQGI